MFIMKVQFSVFTQFQLMMYVSNITVPYNYADEYDLSYC